VFFGYYGVASIACHSFGIETHPEIYFLCSLSHSSGIDLALQINEPVRNGIGDMDTVHEWACTLSLETHCSLGATLAKAGTITHSFKIVAS